MKQVLFSGSAPTGVLTIGNYIGAIKNWLRYQTDYDSVFCVVDLHALTAPQDPALLRERITTFFSLFLACGLDPDRSTVFVQSHNPFHAELAWILNGYTQYGELSRMTQFKERAARGRPLTAGVLNYPVLMAADILLYGTALVPVGEDQKQHVELAREIAQRFNAAHGSILAVPEPFIPPAGARIRNLLDPDRKMDKSDPDARTYISLLDSPDSVRAKIRKARTDSAGSFAVEDKAQGIANLVTIFAELSGDARDDIVDRYRSKGYAALKDDLADCIIVFLSPIQKRYNAIRQDGARLSHFVQVGTGKAIERSQRTMNDVRHAVGIA